MPAGDKSRSHHVVPTDSAPLMGGDVAVARQIERPRSFRRRAVLGVAAIAALGAAVAACSGGTALAGSVRSSVLGLVAVGRSAMPNALLEDRAPPIEGAEPNFSLVEPALEYDIDEVLRRQKEEAERRERRRRRWRPHTFVAGEGEYWCKTVGIRRGVQYKHFGPDARRSPCEAVCCKRPAPGAPRADWRRGSFLAVGDWGYDPVSHGWNVKPECQPLIADKMLEVMWMLGDVKFVVNVGDSFYPNGVSSKDDPQWQTKWRDVFDEEVRSVPWYSVYGNHDYHSDPCICSDDVEACAQVNTGNLSHFEMPSYTYFKDLPELGVEIVGMDLNQFMDGFDHSKTREQNAFADCQWTSCKDTCWSRAKARTDASFDLFHERMAKSIAKSMIVFSHYPTDYFTAAPEFMEALRSPARNITYFGGHRHSTDQTSTASIAPNTNWLVGGGGGWSCDTTSQGFVVGEILLDGSVKTWRVIVDAPTCCAMR